MTALRIFTLPLLLVVLAAGPALAQRPAPPQVDECPAQGMKIHWIADYCMSRLETGDEIAAGPCINKEANKKFRSQCVGKLYYKKALCELAFSRKQLKTDAHQCMHDKDFMGTTVRKGGVGG